MLFKKTTKAKQLRAVKNKNKGIGKIYQEKANQKKAGLSMLVSGKMEFLGVLPRKHLHMYTRRRAQGDMYKDVHFCIICNNEKFKRTYLSIGKLLKILLTLVQSSNGDCSLEIKRRLRLRKEAMEELGKIIKRKDVSLETLIFLITMCKCKSWTVKKAYRKKIQ